MEEEDVKLLMCLRVDDAPPGSLSVADGSIKSNCHECESLVWVSVTGQKIIAQEKARIICNQCFEKMPTDENDPPEIQLRTDVIQELFAQIVRNAGKEGAEPLRLYQFITTMLELPRKPAK